MVEVKFEKFYAQLAEYFADYPELSAKIKDKKFKKTQLAEIVDEYNMWYNRKA
jgi:alpha-L-arabinofuranosidase